MTGAKKIEPDIGFIRTLKGLGGDHVKRGFQCATCTGTCPISPDRNPFPRKEMLWAQWGLKERLVHDPDVWLCHQCNDCSINCPREGNPGDVMAAVRSYAFMHYATPQFMGRFLKSPRYLPLLFGFPAILLLLLIGVVWVAGGLHLQEETIVFEHFVPHYIVDPLFILFAGLAMVAATMGLLRFWKDMSDNRFFEPAASKPSVVQAAIETIREIATHAKFKECDEANFRYLAHMAIFYGFIACFITTTVVFLGLYVFPVDFLTPPLDWYNPAKLLGNVGGIGLIVGCGIAVYRRMTASDKAGTSTYNDMLFVGVLFLVALTGLLTQTMRFLDVAALAYLLYFIHLVFVFFLIAYLPYSKFGHILYRTVAIYFSKLNGREGAVRALPG